MFRPVLTTVVLCSAVAVPCASSGATAVRVPVSYAAPAGNLPVEHLRGAAFDAVLPSGRIVTPAGTSVVTGAGALGLALTPDGRFAIVSDDDDRSSAARSLVDPAASGGSGLAVVDVAAMRVVDRYRDPRTTFWVGIAALTDPSQPGRTLVLASGGPSNAVQVFDLDANGHITLDAARPVTTPARDDAAFADRGRSDPGTIVLARDGRRAYVVNTGAGSVSTIDTATRQLTGTSNAVGFAPFGAAVAGDRLVVSNEGLMRYAVLPQPAAEPVFRGVAPDLDRASSLSLLTLAANGDLADAPGVDTALPMDPTPDGSAVVGGAHPTAIAASPDGAYAYVAMTNVDRIATVSLTGAPRVVGGTELRLFDRGPYGTQPSALALSKDGTRLYVALAGLDAVAVIDARDPRHLHRLGLIPTGWYPTALALAGDDRTLFVLNTRGFGHEAAAANDSASSDTAAASNAPGATWSTLQRIDLTAVQLRSTTPTALANTRRIATARPAYPKAMTHVVVVYEATKTFDAMLGDLGPPYGDPALAAFGADVTPNLHALARRYGLAANMFADGDDGGAGLQTATCGIATLYAQRTLFARNALAPLPGGDDDPEDFARTGTVYNALARHRVSFRDYGALLRVDGYDAGGLYTFDVPALAALAGHVDTRYPGWNPQVADERRADEFVRDYGALVAQAKQPRYTSVWLPAGRGGAGGGAQAEFEQVADGDRALGTIVAYLSHLPSWRHTALFVLPTSAESSRDHVDAYRTYAIVAGPFARRRYVGMHHLSTASVLKTSEQILGLGTLSLGDLLATDMSDFFTATGGDAAPYTALPVPEQASTAQTKGENVVRNRSL